MTKQDIIDQLIENSSLIKTCKKIYGYNRTCLNELQQERKELLYQLEQCKLSNNL